ncbi:MAG TPA: TolC family protein, partial [Verrucomicrobiae bacterium]|nr:TolC family protein [Verrucomicrobiae bacterium]
MKREWIIGAVSLLAWAVPITGQPANPPAGSPADLTVQETIEKVLIHNESLQAKMLDAEIARRQYKAEKGIFEPAVVGSYDRVYNHRENTFEQRAALGGQPEFAEDNNLFNGGLEVLSPLGGKFRLGYDLRRLKNSLNVSIGHEYVSAVGATLTQPLLKNGGIPATMARIRLAAITSDIAYQDYRRQLMLTLSKAESAYWDLYFSQEQESISRESLEIAQALFKDNEERVKVGKSSQLEVLEAEAGVSLRRARRSEAGQRLTEAASQLSILTSGSSTGTNIAVHATEEPKMIEVPLDFYEGYRTAYEKNPDYLTRKAQALAENIRLAYTKNQSLPQLDLKGSYGLNGLGQSVGDSYDDINRADFASWSVGLELRIPITGGIRERNELKAAQLSKQKALVGLKEIEVQMGNALSTAILKVNNLRDSVQDHRSVISFHQQLL